MKKPLHIIKTWFETGDVPTEQQFHDAFDSFHHKDNGEIIVEKTVNDAGDVTFKFTDGEILTIEQFVPDVSKPMEYIDGLVDAINTITTNITTLQTGKVDKVDGKGLSDTNFSQAEKDKLSNLENYIPPSSHPIAFIEGLQTVLDELAQNLTLKVDKEDGKGLSDTNFSQAEKQKLADLNQIWENTANGHVKTKNPSRVAINKNEASAALDVGAKTIRTSLTGSASFEGYQLTGIGTLFLSELAEMNKVELSNGEVIILDYIQDNLTAYSFGGGNASPAGEVTKLVIESSVVNLDDCIKVGRDKYGGKVVEILSRVVNKNGRTTVDLDGYNASTNYNLPNGGSVSWGFSFPSGSPTISVNITKENGIYKFNLSDSTGQKRFSLDENGNFYFKGLPTSAPAGSNQLYKDANGFLKLG